MMQPWIPTPWGRLGFYTYPIIRMSFANGHVETFPVLKFSISDNNCSWSVPGRHRPVQFRLENVESVFQVRVVRRFGIIPKEVFE